ncbi:hypothetical protein BGX21_002070 [Mortierella sp. AD011]|nr:hypothetical protein BGX20_005108 [Mortierella sp. AD010]KAF9401313.1 hypothetical protein BGX21_002070 [Mortierella sp. AD011]
MSSSLSALRRPRPFSFSGPRIAQSTSLSSSVPSNAPVMTHVRRASLAAFWVDSTCPPPPPLTLEQVERLKKAQFQQSYLEQQIDVENIQKLRQQQELQDFLAKDRAVLQQQKSLSRWHCHTEARIEHRQRQDVKRVLDLEQKQFLEQQKLKQKQNEWQRCKSSHEGMIVNAAFDQAESAVPMRTHCRTQSMFGFRGSN